MDHQNHCSMSHARNTIQQVHQWTFKCWHLAEQKNAQPDGDRRSKSIRQTCGNGRRKDDSASKRVIRFITQAVRNCRSTGALAPSSRFLGRTMVKSMPMTKNQRILEVGPGTGAVTKHILANLRCGDELHIVELNEEFCQHLEQHLLKPFRTTDSGAGVKVVLHNTPIEEAGLEGNFDTIICCLPFNNFPINVVQHLFDIMFDLLSSDGELVYFEYLGMRWLKRVFGISSIRKETKLRTTDIQARFEKQKGCQCAVWRNFPSCRVVRLKR